MPRFAIALAVVILFGASGCGFNSTPSLATVLDASGPIWANQPSLLAATSIETLRALIPSFRECSAPGAKLDCWTGRYPANSVFLAVAPPAGCGWDSENATLTGSKLTFTAVAGRCAGPQAAALPTYRLFGIQKDRLPHSVISIVTAGDLNPGHARLDLRKSGNADVPATTAALALAAAPLQATLDDIFQWGPPDGVDFGIWAQCQPSDDPAAEPGVVISLYGFGHGVHYQWDGGGVALCDGPTGGHPSTSAGFVAAVSLPPSYLVQDVELESGDRNFSTFPERDQPVNVVSIGGIPPGTYALKVNAFDPSSRLVRFASSPSTITLTSGRVPAVSLATTPQ